MSYIRYHEMEKLFTVWPTLDAVLESLAYELNTIKLNHEVFGSNDDYIYSLCIGNKALDDMPPTGRISDSTGNIAVNYAKIMRRNKKEVSNEVSDEILRISFVVDKLDIAFRRLNSLQQQVLKFYYWEEKPWRVIMESLNKEGHYISQRHAQEQKHIALQKMGTISKITNEAYEHIMELID